MSFLIQQQQSKAL